MPCRVDLFHCNRCGGEHYYANECLTDPSKFGEGLIGYSPKTAIVKGQKAIDKMAKARENFDTDGALCDLLTSLEDKKMLTQAAVPRAVLDWWEGHQSREKNKIRKEALSKLSTKEKRALGLIHNGKKTAHKS